MAKPAAGARKRKRARKMPFSARSRKSSISARSVCTAVVLTLGLAAGTVPALAEGPGVGDPYYPNDGNSGYDVQHYQVGIAWDAAKRDFLTGDTTITGVAEEDLARFNLDLEGFAVQSVTVDGIPVRSFERQGKHELVITPAQQVENGSTFKVRVRYSGKPVGEGWYRLDGGGVAAYGEPHSATAWYPANDHPSDKATFGLTATVPSDWSVVGNGLPGQTTTANGKKTFRWNEDKPLATYLSMMAIDKFDIHESTLADGTPTIFAYGTGTQRLPESEEQFPDIVSFLSSKFGEYPFSSAGSVVISPQGSGHSTALETQGKSTYSGTFFDASAVHETTHQWFGDSVSIDDWRNACLNECIAQYANQLWEESKGANIDENYLETVKENLSKPEFWGTKLYDPGPGKELDPALYHKGLLMMHAMRKTVGDDAFFGTLREWASANQYANASFPEFEKLAQQISGKDLRGFFADWAHSEHIPADQYLYSGSLHE